MQRKQLLLYGGAGVLLLGAGYVVVRHRQSAGNPGGGNDGGVPYGPGYPFVTGGPGGQTGGLITCPDGTIVTDPSQCTTAGGGPGGQCGASGQACCAGHACNAGLTCSSNVCQPPVTGGCSKTPTPCAQAESGAGVRCTCCDGVAIGPIKHPSGWCASHAVTDVCDNACRGFGAACSCKKAATAGDAAGAASPFGARG